MLSEYKFAPPGTKVTALPTSLHSEAPPPSPAPAENGKDVVRMEPFEVHESGMSNAAYLPLARRAPDKPPATVASKLGIGEHSVEVGKVHAFVVTVFYVPILAGFSW
jgi:hypothetical protein